jgi:activator of 2-hydroxyglutaryl-CoA dehydratase
MMNLLDTPIEELDDFVVGKEPIQINSMCTVFAESEIISLLAEEADPAEIALGVLHSICKRTCAFVQKLPMQDHLFFSGGLSRSKVFTRLLGSYLGCELHTDAEAPFAGAIGAALLGYRTIS